ncbi:DNA nucleotidylexotransferase [Bagarius yarrelli]|uniref:DNA nucleotidylexotransferase n=1 Tax=Bagarius yarrelli TaxID=175774 RepID=A0A556TMP0_BAGYA|nr:DNA nucleotidylexotransferase [Bagarius yarrelli]
MGKTRRNFLAGLARSKGFCVENTLSSNVTHIVAEDNPADELWLWLQKQGIADLDKINVLDISWFTQSMSAGRPIPVEVQHRIEDALEVLAENYELIESVGPCLGFKKAASVLKSLPVPVRSIRDVEGLPCLGPETMAVIEDIFEFGSSSKVEDVLKDERYQTLKIFTSVFGVGPKTAEKWYRQGLRNLTQIVSDSTIHLNNMQKAGFQYYDDISKPVSKAEAEALSRIIVEIAGCVNPEVTVTLTGGFRRGKEFGHDVDFLLHVPGPGKEDGLLPAVIDRLRSQGVLLYLDFQESTFDISKLPSCRFEAMDHFQKCFLILKLKKEQVVGQQVEQRCGKDWKAVRVDLVAPPAECYPFALLGWSGSTVRDERSCIK